MLDQIHDLRPHLIFLFSVGGHQEPNRDVALVVGFLVDVSEHLVQIAIQTDFGANDRLRRPGIAVFPGWNQAAEDSRDIHDLLTGEFPSVVLRSRLRGTITTATSDSRSRAP